jgi:hypothetical protein
MTKSKTAKTDVIAVRIDPHTKETIAAIGKTPTEMINSGLEHQIRSHTHVLLERIFKTKLQQGWLSQTDWEYLSYHIYLAFESTTLTNWNFTSAQMLDIHNAFRDLVASAIPADSTAIYYYKGNLGSHAESPATKSALLVAIEAAKELIRSHWDKHPWSNRPFSGLIGRNLNVALRDEKMDQLQINKALIPYWQTIWHIVASKHWHDSQMPIDLMTNENWAPLAKDVEIFREGDTTITVWTLDDRPDIQINIFLKRHNLFWCPNSFPAIQELQRALSSVPKEIKQEHNCITFWDGPSYKVYVYDRTSGYDSTSDQYTPEIAFSINKTNLTVYFQQPEWESLQKLLNQALSQTDIPLRVDALKLQYGSSF